MQRKMSLHKICHSKDISEAVGFALCLPVLVTHFLLVKCIRYDAHELLSERFRHELLDVHHRHEVFAAEPVSLLAHLRFTEVAGVASWYLLSRAVVLPEVVFHRVCLR